MQFYTSRATILGHLQKRDKVEYERTLSRSDKRATILFSVLMLLTSAALIGYVFSAVITSSLSYVLLLALAFVFIVELIRLLQSLTLIFFALHAKDPIPMVPGSNLRIAVLTTIVPGKEPLDLVARTLREMKRIYPGKGNTLDVWLLDEGNDEIVKQTCEKLGVNHFSRKGIDRWNTTSGTFKAKTKHGNHNAWRSAHENQYDIVAQMDPDHVPRNNFLTRTLGYFTDPDVAFVVAPQVYGNLKDNWIARASAFQAYIFHGIIQRGGNGLKAPLLIGTNHLYRVAAFKSIDGYQDSIIEDHLTSMVIYGTKNESGRKWTGVYTPDILAVGEGPTSFTDYFNQQKRWAYGIWEIAINKTPHAVKNMTKSQALMFFMLQFFYPSIAIAWVISSFSTLLFGIYTLDFNGTGLMLATLWLYSVISSLWLFFWLRKFNLVEHERKDWGIEGMLLLLMCIPVYASAAWEALRRKPLTYAVTAKGDLASPDNLQTFVPHLKWLLFNVAGLLILLIVTGALNSSSVFWMVEHAAICALPIGIWLYASTAHYLNRQLQSAKALVRKSRFVQAAFANR